MKVSTQEKKTNEFDFSKYQDISLQAGAIEIRSKQEAFAKQKNQKTGSRSLVTLQIPREVFIPNEQNGRFYKAELVIPNISNEYSRGSLLRMEEQSPESEQENEQNDE